MTTIFPITPTIKKISVGHSNVSVLSTMYYYILDIGIYIESLLKNSIVLLLKEDGEW